MVSFTIATVLASLAALAPLASAAPASSNFKLSTCAVSGGNSKFSNLWLTPYYTYSTVNNVVGVPEQNDSAVYTFDSTTILQKRETYEYGVYLDSARPSQTKHGKTTHTAPVGYNDIEFTLPAAGGEAATAGFYQEDVGGTPYLRRLGFTPSAKEKALDFKVFTVCYVDSVMTTPPKQGPSGPQYQLLYRTKGSARNNKQCSDVDVYVHYKNPKTGKFYNGSPC